MITNINFGKKLRKWTENETKTLKELYPRMRVKNLAKFFPWRNKATIVAKAKSLNLPSAKLWQSEEDNILKLCFVKDTKKNLLKLLPKRSWLAIMARGERLGLKRERRRPRRAVNETYFKKWTASMAYVLGFMLADGCIIKGSYEGYSDSLKFGVQLCDVDILNKIKMELRSEHTISKIKNAAHLCISSQELVDDLKKLGIIYRKSLNEQWPNIPHEYVKDFIRGIMDGDGSIHFDKRGYPTISLCGGKTTLENVRNHFIKTLGTYSKLDRRSYSESCKNFLYQIAYRCNSAKKIVAYLYNNAPIYLDRKFKLAQKCLLLGIKDRNKYSYLENKIISELYKSSSAAKLLQKLPRRSWGSIQRQARLMGVYKYKIRNRL